MSENSQCKGGEWAILAFMKREEIYYRAMLARDARFDGKFFVAVRTTGIYCRPICPARPKRENIEFYPTQRAAEAAGYRRCLRCRPETAPRSPAWVGKSAMVKRAVKSLDKIEKGEKFAEKFGVSARHLRRVFRDEIGKTPTQLSHLNRLMLARDLLTGSSLSISEIAFASGFSSIRRFNDAFKKHFRKSPGQVRRRKVAAGGVVTIALPYRPPFDFEGLLRIYRSHQVGRLEFFGESHMERVVAISGKVGKVKIFHEPAQHHLRLEVDFPDLTELPVIVAKVRSLFDLDSDPVIVANVLENDARIGKMLKTYPGIRLPSGWDGFEIGVAAILGQVVSVQRGRALVDDLIELLGERRRLPDGTELKLFPTPDEVAKADLLSIKTTGGRRAALRGFAEAVASGRISLEPTQDVETFSNALMEIRGIGPWTASYMALKILRHTDAFPATDLILARALEKHSAKKIAAMSPWRGYVAALMWRTHGDSLKKTRRSAT